MKKIIAVFITLAVIVAILFIPVKSVFSFEGTRNHQGEALYIPFHKDESEFQIIYTHSIHLSDVVEYYQVTDDFMIRSVAMEYEDLAIGMPGYAEEGETLTMVDGKYRLSYDNNTTKEFTMHISNITNMQHFVYDGVEYDLKEVLHKGASYLFKVKKISIFQWWKGGFHK